MNEPTNRVTDWQSANKNCFIFINFIMGTEVAISFSALRTQLENEKSSLFKIDENIKKIVQTSGRFPNDRLMIGSSCDFIAFIDYVFI